MQSTKEFLDRAASEYYKGNSIISDDEFDRLAESINYTQVGTKQDNTSIPNVFFTESI